jgi:phage recombination protein Bet
MGAPMTALVTIGGKLSQRFGMGGDTTEVLDILRHTAFKGGNVTDAQMTSLMIVADQYGLNPWTREIYAFPDKSGIVPVVGVDGWSRIINEHPQFDGVEFEQNEDSCTCIMYRKDRAHATKVTEWLSECKRDNAQPWKTHPKRMLRHKALIQCARLAFGFVGIYDQDEAERIVEKPVNGEVIDNTTGEILPKSLPAYTDEQMDKNIPAWQAAINKGKSHDTIVSMVKSKYSITEDQEKTIRGITKELPKEEKREPVTIENESPAIDEKDLPFV